MEQGDVEDAASYVRKAYAQLSKHKDCGVLLVWIAEQSLQRGNKKEALIFYNNARSIGGNKPLVLNNVGWVFATHSDKDMRNGAVALQVAQRANQLTQFKQPSYLDTLAAAYAEVGDFPEAIRVARSALKLAKQQQNTPIVQGLEKALKLYKQGRPMR